jgi:DNA polymerase I
MKKQIYVVDVSSMFFRAFYAIRPLTSSKGTPVNAVYGFISMIIKLMKEKNPDHIVFCYDRKEPSFRKDLYTEYKANRSTMPDDMQVQMPYLKQVAGLFGICDMELPGFEADDLIGTVARLARKEDYEVFIVSGDKDFCQLIDENVFLYDTMKEVIFDVDMVKEKHGVTPAQFKDFLAITGDTSDNIPGVAGIGPKGAQKLIEQFGTLEGVYENIEQVSSASIKEKLISSKEKAILSKVLVTIVCDAPITQTIEDFKIKPFKTEELRAFLQELNFKTFEKNLLGEGQSGFVPSPVKTKDLIKTETAPVAKSVSSADYKSQVLAWDEDLLQKRIDAGHEFFAFTEYGHFALGFAGELFITEIENCKLNFKNTIWNGFDTKKIAVGLKLKSFQVNWDLMLSSYVLRAADSSSIEKLADFFLHDKIDIDSIELISDKMRTCYEVLLQINEVVIKELEEKDLRVIYEKLEKPMISLLFDMEQRGIKLDLKFLKTFSEELGLELAQQEKTIHEMAGEDFNVASPKQLGVILFEKIGLESIKKTKTGYSTDNDVLEKLPHPIAKEIIHYREVAKLKSTYVDALPQLADENGRVHTYFNQALTATGRLSSTNPNLQNIPIKTEKGQKVRKAFVASEGK